MNISQSQIEEFKQIYKETFGVDLDDKTALDKAQNLLCFFKAILQANN